MVVKHIAGVDKDGIMHGEPTVKVQCTRILAFGNVHIWCKFVYEDFPVFLIIDKKNLFIKEVKIINVLIDILKKKIERCHL